MLNNQQIVSLKPETKLYKRGIGNGLYMVVHPNGSKYFTGRIKRKEFWVGTYGNKGGQLSLADARSKFYEIKDYCFKHEVSYSDYKRNKEKVKSEEWNLNDAISKFLEKRKGTIKPTTHREYTRKMNQVLSLVDGNTPLKEFEWDNGGREKMEDIITQIEKGGKGNNFDLGRRVRNLLKQVFAQAIRKGKMSRGQNPAFLEDGSDEETYTTQHHPSIDWEEVPELLEKVSLNPSNSHPISQLAVKLTLMTFLRSGALTRLEWKMIDWEKKLITIDGSTSGLKRRKGKNDDKPHHVPITPQMEKILLRAKRFNQGEKYVFPPLKKSRFDHLDPSAPNNFLRTLGYEGKLVSHGWRSVALTNGIDLLKTPREVIKKQMGHLPDNKVDKAYDKSLMIEERREFLNKWCELLVANGLEI